MSRNREGRALPAAPVQGLFAMDTAPTRSLPALATVVLAAVALAWFYYTGLYCSDDTRYLLGAIKIAMGEEIAVGSLAERRAAFLLPAAAVFALTESIDLAIAVYGLFLVGIGVVTLLIARRLLPIGAAWVATLLALAQPVLFLFAGALLPDLASAFFLALALYFLIRAPGLGDRHPGRLAMAAVGGCIAAGFAMKESSIVLLAIPLGWLGLLGLHGRWLDAIKGGGLLLAGFVAVLLLEALVFRATAGQWYSSVASLFAPHDFSGYVESQGRTPLERLRTLRGLLGPHTSWLFLLAGVSMLHLVLQCVRRGLGEGAVAWLLVAGFWAWPTFYFTLGTASLSAYAFPVMQQRYYAPSIVPAALLAVHLLQVAAAPLWRRYRFVQLLPMAILVLLCSAPYLERYKRGLIYGAGAKEALELAVHDARQRYPDLPLLDSHSGWTTDLHRCRALLMQDVEGGRDRLLAAIRSGDDLGGQFGYVDAAELNEPVLMLGHGPFLSNGGESRWARALLARVERGELIAEHLARYRVQSRRALRGLMWLPRQQAARSAMRRAGRERELGGAPVPGEEVHSVVDLYLLRPAGSH